MITSGTSPNAAAFGKGNIRVRITEGFNKVVIDVVDDGDGVGPEDVESIFEPYHSSRQADRLTPSLGLGLSVARRLARALGGDARYMRDDRKTVFELSLLHPVAVGPSHGVTRQHQTRTLVARPIMGGGLDDGAEVHRNRVELHPLEVQPGCDEEIVDDMGGLEGLDGEQLDDLAPHPGAEVPGSVAEQLGDADDSGPWIIDSRRSDLDGSLDLWRPRREPCRVSFASCAPGGGVARVHPTQVSMSPCR